MSSETLVGEAAINRIVEGDCVTQLDTLAPASIELAFADPPFNIGFDYDLYDDSLEHQQYVDWSRRWIAAVARVLKPDGTFWLAIGDEYAAELKLASQEIGFHCRSWVIWYYTFGVNCSKKFTRSHAHLFHFVKDPESFTFRDDDLDNRVPSARELVYNDKRANPRGRLPDDTWILRPADAVGEVVGDDDATWFPQHLDPPADNDRTYVLRPQDLEHSFQASEDTWYFPRVAGTFKERAGFHGCQMPEQLLGRIIRTCSHPGATVLDPFAGSATTLAVAKKLGRKFLGFELSPDYVQYGQQRLSQIRVGDPLDGSPEPLKSAPQTGKRSRKQGQSRAKLGSLPEGNLFAAEERYQQVQLELTLQGIVEAFRLTHAGFSADRVVTDPDLNQAFVEACGRLGLVGDPRTWNMLLFRLRKSGRLCDIPTHHRTALSWIDCDKFMFASEIAWQSMLNEQLAASLDEILCDPALAAQFDDRARRLAPNHTSLEYRWAALKLRKEAKCARTRAALLTPPARLGQAMALDELTAGALPAEPGLYVVSEKPTRQLYVGETLDLRDRLSPMRNQEDAWHTFAATIRVQALSVDHASAGRLAWQSCLARKFKQRPCLNYFELCSAT